MGFCSQGATNNNCSSAQTYCNVGKQLVSQNNIDATIKIAQGDLSTAEKWQLIKDILTNIYDFGNLGTRNPEQIDNITGIDKSNITYLSMYNAIIDALQTGTDSINADNGEKIFVGQLISKSLIDILQTTILNYKLNSDRCESCNSNCNATCFGCNSCNASCENADCAWYTGGCSQGCTNCVGYCEWGGGPDCSTNLY